MENQSDIMWIRLKNCKTEEDLKDYNGFHLHLRKSHLKCLLERLEGPEDESEEAPSMSAQDDM